MDSFFLFSEESIKGIANHAIPIPFSPSQRKHKKEFGMMNSFFLFSHKSKIGNWICLHPPGSLVPTLSLHANGAWEWSSCTWLVTFELKIFPCMLNDYLASWWGRRGSGRSCHVQWTMSRGLKVDVVGSSPPLTLHWSVYLQSTWRDIIHCTWQDLPDPLLPHQEAR